MALAPLSLARRMLFGRKASPVSDAGSALDGARKRPFRLLAIDGGGIRGILPAMVLADLERRTNRPIIDLFDMIVGTSTGGLIALALACPGEDGRPRHKARDLIRFYEVEGRRVFSRSVWHKIRAVGNLADEKYPSSGMDVLERYFGDCRLKDALCDVVVVLRLSDEAGDPRRYRRTDVLRAGTHHHRWAKRLLCLGRRRAVRLQPGDVRLYRGAEPLPRSRVDHAGLARHRRADATPAYDDVKDWGAARWAQPTFALMCDGVCDVVDYQLQQLLPSAPDGMRQYYRFQARLDVGSDDMDDASSTNIRVLKLLAEDMLQANRATLRRLSEQLLRWAPARPDAPPPNIAADPTPSGDSLYEAARAMANDGTDP
jgi:hypothetical protein